MAERTLGHVAAFASKIDAGSRRNVVELTPDALGSDIGSSNGGDDSNAEGRNSDLADIGSIPPESDPGARLLALASSGLGGSASGGGDPVENAGEAARPVVVWRGDIAERKFAPLVVDEVSLEDKEAGDGSMITRKWPVFGMSFHQCGSIADGHALCKRLGFLQGSGSSRDPMGSAVAPDSKGNSPAAAIVRAQVAREKSIGEFVAGAWATSAASLRSELAQSMEHLQASEIDPTSIEVKGWELRKPSRSRTAGATKPDGSTAAEASIGFTPRALGRSVQA